MFVSEIEKSIRYLKGIGPELSKKLNKIGIGSIGELLTYYPRAYDNRLKQTNISESLKNDSNANTVIEVLAHDYIGFGKKAALKIIVQDTEGTRASLVCFGRLFLKNKFAVGKKFFVSAKFIYKYNEIQSPNFDFEEYSENPVLFNKILPVYPLTEGISQSLLRKTMDSCISEFRRGIDSELPEYILDKYSFTSKMESISTVHFPENFEKLHKALKHLKYEELFYLQLPSIRRNLERKIKKERAASINFGLQKKLTETLPFRLTDDQTKALTDINNDLEKSYPMSRLLQGDVGCGKTLVALLSAAGLVSAGYQAAFLVPTSVLAEQHYRNALELFKKENINIFLISGKTDKQVKENVYNSMSSNVPGIYIGTHALFSGKTAFSNLRYIIIDEQHKFGVMQRISMKEKGSNPDILLMTATPIPRTLCLTAFGDMDISVIKTMPADRKKVITHLAREDNSDKVYKRVKEELETGKQAYFIYPLINESEKLELKDAENMYSHLKENVFPEYKIELIHSRIADQDKTEIMDKFKQHKVDILVATSVLEVGIDVSNATVIVIEHAERFGLSSLHQLRGRVGRGSDQSYAFLIYSNELTEEGKKRLMAMKESTDGFKIAEEDLLIRGPGDIKGTQQSGFLRLKIADIVNDFEIIREAKSDIEEILNKDQGLINPENSVILKALNNQEKQIHV